MIYHVLTRALGIQPLSIWQFAPRHLHTDLHGVGDILARDGWYLIFSVFPFFFSTSWTIFSSFCSPGITHEQFEFMLQIWHQKNYDDKLPRQSYSLCPLPTPAGIQKQNSFKYFERWITRGLDSIKSVLHMYVLPQNMLRPFQKVSYTTKGQVTRVRWVRPRSG